MVLSGALLFFASFARFDPELSTSAVRELAGASAVRVDPCHRLYDLVCKPEGETLDPTGSVQRDIYGERRATDIYSETIQKYPNSTPEQIDEAVVAQIFTPKKRGRLKAAFRYASDAIQKLIHQSDQFTAHEKNILIARIQRTTLELPPPASVYADEPALITKNEVFYERTSDGTLRLRVGGAYLFVVRSWFNLVFTMGHELAHAIDPCEVRSAHLAFPAYDRLIACFLDVRIVPSAPARSECGSHDQLSEVFADWIAIQIAAETLEHFSTEFDREQIIASVRNSVRDLCDQDSDLGGGGAKIDLEFYPSPEMRIQSFGHNPKVRSVLGCQATSEVKTYCTFDWKKL